MADTSISGAGVAREPDALVRVYGKPACIVSPSRDIAAQCPAGSGNGTEFTSRAILKRAGGNHVDRHYTDGSQFWCQVFGQSTTPQDPYAHCVWTFIDLSDQRPVVDLTRREREIAMLLIEGLTNKHIGQKLGILHRTVEAHRSRMMRKLSAKNSAELLSNSSAYQLGVITQC